MFRLNLFVTSPMHSSSLRIAFSKLLKQVAVIVKFVSLSWEYKRGFAQSREQWKSFMHLFRQRLSKKSVKAHATMPKGSLGNTKKISLKARNPYFPPSRIHIVSSVERRLEMAGNMDSELLSKFIGYFPDYLSALSRTLLRFFLNNLCRNSCI